jgi:eukaryotic-like serine/threonine-protein kinase
MRLSTGSRLGPYEITSAIGAGGMGEVYRARDTRLGREVAIKVLPRDLTRDPERLARFEREARTASTLNHRNIVTVHDFTADERETWLVMELVRGESLRDLISRGPVGAKQLLAIGAGIADGLAAAHAAGIVHRDLKPENVMVVGDGTAKILDFGLVKQNAALSHPSNSPTELAVTRAGVVMGTIDYMSPEQARGDDVDFRTDHFSLGVMLYELATGTHPFRRETAPETMAAILKEEAPPLDETFGWIVERCLAKTPDGRYGSTSDLAHDLHRLSLAPSGSHRRITASVGARGGWWPVMAAGVGIIALAAGAALATWLRPARPRESSYQATVATPEIAHVFRDEVALPLALSPDGRFLVVYGTDTDGIPALWLRNLQSGTTRLVAQNTFSVGWSSDGRSIAYISEGKLMTAPVDGGPPRVICDARPEGTPAWHGDTILFTQYSTQPNGLFRVSATAGKPELAMPSAAGPTGLPWWPQFLPDGRRFLYLTVGQRGQTGTIDHELLVGSLDGQPPTHVPLTIDSRAVYAAGHLLYVRDGTLLAQPFDPDSARTTGDPQPIVEDIHYFRNTGLAAFSVSENGVLAWRAPRRPSRVVWIDRAGTEVRTVASGFFMPPGRLSPDGNRYAVSVVDPKQGVADVWIYDLDRDSSERATFKVHDDIAPIWASDGRAIYYRSDCCGPPDILRWTPGADEATVITSDPGLEEPQDVSPDGKWLLFVDHRQAGAADIHVLPLAPPGPRRPFVATPFNEFSPRFSRDGRWVAFESNISGRPEIYMRPFEGAAQSMRLSRDGGTRPRWRRDGKELFFFGPGGRLMSVPMNGGSAAGPPRMLFQATGAIDFEPSADGSRFLTQLEQRTTEPVVHLLINWPARLSAER